MSATILLKRTLGTSPPNIAPVGTGVSFGELIYTYDTSDVGAGKSYKKLYIGNPAGPTAPPIAVGGEYYTSLFNDNPASYGTPQASKVLILDSQGRVASWTVVDDFYTAGVGTVAGDFAVGGNLNVTGDLVYGEANARNWNITGVATAATLDVSAAGFSTAAVDDFRAVLGVVTTLSGTSADYYEVNVGHALTANNAEITVDLYRSSTAYHIAKTVSVPADSTLDILSKAIYLEEGDALRLTANAASDLEAVCSYEEIS